MQKVNAWAPPTLVNSTSSARLSQIGASLQGFTVLYEVSFERRFSNIDVFSRVLSTQSLVAHPRPHSKDRSLPLSELMIRVYPVLELNCDLGPVMLISGRTGTAAVLSKHTLISFHSR